MKTPTLVIGEHSLLHLAEVGTETMNAWIDLIDQAEDDAMVMAWEDLYEAPVDQFDSLSDCLFGPEATLDRDARLRLGTKIQRLPAWGHDDASPPMEWTDETESYDIAPSIGLCAEKVGSDPWALLSLPGASSMVERHSIQPVQGGQPCEVWFIMERAHLSRFWQDSLIRYDASTSEMAGAASPSFPDTIFAEGIWGQVNRFEGTWRDVRQRLVPVLSGLNESAARVFGALVENHQRATALNSEHGVNCSPESPNTHQNAAAMRRREATFSGRTMVCEWHAKLEPHRNRVHFTVEGDRLYVGIFAEHLPL